MVTRVSINEVVLHSAWLVVRWATAFMQINHVCVTSNLGQLSLAIPQWVGNGYGHCRGREMSGLLVYWPSGLKAPAVKMNRPSRSYTSLVWFNSRWLKAPKMG